MSDYDSSSQGSEQNQKDEQYFQVFQHDFYLSASLPNMQQWKQNINNALQLTKQINPFKYLQKEKCIFDKQENHLRAAYHIRYYSFAFYLKRAFESLIKQYQNAYLEQKFEAHKIQTLDNKVIDLSFYLQKIQLSRAASYIQQIDNELIRQIYNLMQSLFPFMISNYCIWRIVMFLQIMNQQKSAHVLNIPFNMTLEYYQKTFKTLKFKHQKLTKIATAINNDLEKEQYFNSYVKAVKEICQYKKRMGEDNPEIEESLICEFVCCLRYMYFATSESHKTDKSLYLEYIMSSLKVPYYGKNQNMPTQYYEKLFLRILKELRNQPKLIDLALYIDPNIVGERSQQSFGKLEEVVLNLCRQILQAQQAFLKNKQQPSKQYLKKLLNDQQFTLLIQFLQTIMVFNKSAFLKADNQIYEIFVDMAEFLKNAFLSFGKDLWLFPQNLFSPLTLGFFKKIAEDINDDLKNILYQMVQNLNNDRLPQKLTSQNGQLKLVNVTRLQYLSAMMYYIEDCSRQEEYLNLPQVAPANFETSILMIKSLHVKLKHHEPNPAQMPLFIQYLRECQKYKLNIKFSWYKQQNYLSKSFERQTQFQIESGLPCKQIQQHFRKCLNYRDRQYARKLIEQDYNSKHLISAVQLAALLKYNHGIQNLSQIQNVRQQQIFMLLQEMQTMLAILPNQLFDLPLQEEINVSYLHLLLSFYCSKIKQAKGSEIYFMIHQKVLLNYLKSPFNKSQQFKKKYPKFFQRFIYQYHQIQICTTLNDLLLQFEQKNLPVSKDQNQWSAEQKTSVNDLKDKIQIIRDEFLDKLEGSQQEIAIFMVTFTSLISESLPFVIFMECVRLFVKLVLRKPSLGEIASITIFLSGPTYNKPKFFAKILNYFEDFIAQNSTQKKEVKSYILAHLLKSSEILEVVTFKQIMELLHHAKKLLVLQDDSNYLEKVFSSMKTVVTNQPDKIRPEWILAYILLNRYGLQGGGQFAIFEEQPEKRQVENSKKMKQLLNVLKRFESNKQFWSQVRVNLKDFKFKEFYFLFEFTYEFKNLMNAKQDPVSFESIWLYFLKQLNDPSWTFYYMLRLNEPSLINIHENRDEMLINLIKKEKLTKQSYPIFKNMISQTKNMPFILQKILQSYQNQENYVQNFQFHNKLILINERFPDAKIEECILRWIQVGQNKLPLKIPQNYYINFIKKKLKNIPQNVAYDSILKKYSTPEQLSKLNKQTQKLFDILLYFPIKKFQAISLNKITGEKQALKQEKSEQKIEGQVEDQGDWQQQEDQTGEIDIKKTSGKKNEKQNNNLQNNSEQNSEQQNNPNDGEQDINEQNSQNSDNNNYYDDKPDIVEIFYEENEKAQFQSYKQFCKLREEIDVYLKSDYEKLKNSPIQDNQYIHNKLMALVKQLANLKQSIQQSILIYLPDPLYQALKKLDYKTQRVQQKLEKLRKPKNKIFHLQRQLFSDRGQSDDESADQQEYSSEGYGDQDAQGDNEWENQDDENMDEDSPQQQPIKIQKKNKISDDSDQQIELPDLTTQFSKVESQIKGSQLDRRQLTKILEIFLVQIFKLTPINFKKKQIVFSYVQIMQSDLGQVFFESVLTLLRMDENHKRNRKVLLQKMKQTLQNQGLKFNIEQLSGLPQFSKYNGMVNFAHLLKTLKDKEKYLNDETNPFRKQSGTLLPIAQKCIIEFDLPIQTNVFSLVLIYIHSKQKIRDLIEQISVSYPDNQVKLTKKQIKRISEAFLRQKTHSSVWEFIQGVINYQVKDTDRLIISLDSYSQQVFNALASSGKRVKQTIEKNNQIFNKKINSQTQIKTGNTNHIKHYQRLYYITSNLLSSCSQQIKQFYFMNKQICRYLWDDDEQNQENYNYNKVPKKLIKCKQEIYQNQSFVHLLQLSIRIIYFVKKQLYGKISPKKFARLIHYPKLIIQTATLYMHLSGSKGTKSNWNFLPKKQAQKIIDEYQMGQKKFKDLVQVYNLTIGLLQIQSFCTGKFKQLLIPYFTKNKQIGLQAPLMFKVPEIDEDVNGQNIFITRQCSFDMALYQVNGEGLFVEFHGQQGSDHGGLIREFMMGWKGVGVGQQDFFIGKILGISFRQSVPYGGNVDLQMCIKIANYKITMQNIEEIDKDIYNSLKYIKQNDPQNLGLTFSATKKNPKSFDVQEFNLKSNGNEINVTQQNKEEYIKLYLQKYYELGRQHELSQIAIGFYSVVSPTYASIFKPNQLMQHIKGQQVCDINVLKAHVKYIEGYTQTSVIIKWLWQILQGYNQQQLNKFIQFLTGSPKLPIFNPNFEITIERVFEVKNLPVAHTCFNTLDLPQYPTKDILQKHLLTAIFQGNDNFGIM